MGLIPAQVPKGKLLIIGGGEAREEKDLEAALNNNEFQHYEILKRLLPNGPSSKKIEIVTTASSEPERIEKQYRHAFKDLGFSNFGFIHITSNQDAKDPKLIKRVSLAHVVFLAGGSQLRLSTVLGDTPFLDEVFRRYMLDEKFILAGTSAGAAAMNTIMMYEGENNEVLLKETVELSSGLGFLNNVLIDTHFVERGRFGRLVQAVIMNPACLGVGLGEDSALLISSNEIAECLGSGMVVIIDGRDIDATNISYAQKNDPIYIENIRVHILCKGTGFLLSERKFLATEEDIHKMEKLKPTQLLNKLKVKKKRKTVKP